MRRSEAERLLDSVRKLSAHQTQNGALASLLEEAGLSPFTPCPGEAHSNAYIDNCGVCAPRWGWVGKRERVT